MSAELRFLLAPWLRSPRIGLQLALAPALETFVLLAGVWHAGGGPRDGLFAWLVVMAAIAPCTSCPIYAARALASDGNDAAASAAQAPSHLYDTVLLAELLRGLCLVWTSAPVLLLAHAVLGPERGLVLVATLHAAALLALACGLVSSVLAQSTLVACVSAYVLLASAMATAGGIAAQLAPFRRAAGMTGLGAFPVLLAVTALALIVVGRAAFRRRGAHYR